MSERPVSLDELLNGPAPSAPPPEMALDQIPVGHKQCAQCKVVHPLNVSTWQYVRGKPWGNICRLCKRGNRAESKRKLAQNGLPRPPAPAIRPVLGGNSVVDERAAERKLARLRTNAAVATATRTNTKALRESIIEQVLKKGVDELSSKMPEAFRIICEYAVDQTSVHHEWALKFIAERGMPKRIFEELGAKAAGVEGGLEGRGPTYIVNIVAAPTPGAMAIPAQRVLSAPDDVIDVEDLGAKQ